MLLCKCQGETRHAAAAGPADAPSSSQHLPFFFFFFFFETLLFLVNNDRKRAVRGLTISVWVCVCASISFYFYFLPPPPSSIDIFKTSRHLEASGEAKITKHTGRNQCQDGGEEEEKDWKGEKKKEKVCV